MSNSSHEQSPSRPPVTPEETARLREQQKQRQQMIESILSTHTVRSLPELMEQLAKQGIQASKATVSRDLAFLHYYKINGHYQKDTMQDEAARELEQFIQTQSLKITKSVRFLAVKTKKGNGRAVAVAFEKIYPKNIFGTVSDENIALLLFRNEDTRKRIYDDITGRLSVKGTHKVLLSDED